MPHAGSGDPDAALLGMLGMSANVSVVDARTAVSREYAYDSSAFYGLDPGQNEWDVLKAAVDGQIQSATGQAPPAVPLAELGLDPGISTTLDAPWVIDPKRPLLTGPVLYLSKIASLKPMALWNAGSAFDFHPIPLLALLARHSVLHEYAEAAARRLRITGLSRRDLAIVSLELPTPQARDWLNTIVKVGSTATIGDVLHDAVANPDARLQEVRNAAHALAGVDPGRLELLLRETLGLSAGRLDAWITGLATKRLGDVRAAGAAGIHLGAYGWVESVRPDTSLKRVKPPLGESKTLELYHSTANAGYVHAPSLDHAPLPPCCAAATCRTPQPVTALRSPSISPRSACASRPGCSTASARGSRSALCSATGSNALFTSAIPGSTWTSASLPCARSSRSRAAS